MEEEAPGLGGLLPGGGVACDGGGWRRKEWGKKRMREKPSKTCRPRPLSCPIYASGTTAPSSGSTGPGKNRHSGDTALHSAVKHAQR